MDLLFVGLYIVSIIVSYFLIRWNYILLGYKARNQPHGFVVFTMLIPVINVMVGVISVVSELKFNYKKFFMLKDKEKEFGDL